MVHRIIKQYVDDIDGSEEDVRPVRISSPYEFAPNDPNASTLYTVDLGPANREAYRQAIAPFISKGRRVTGYDPEALRPNEGPLIREWAEKKGIKLKPKGRIPKDVVEQFREETV